MLGSNDITDLTKLMFRVMFLSRLTDVSEINIFRSYYLAPTKMKLVLSWLSVCIQIVLAIVLVWHVIDNWNWPDLSDYKQAVMVGVSLFVLIFLSNLTKKTITNFISFYRDINLVFKVPATLLICDFISNVVVAVVITLVSFFLLSDSENFAEIGLYFLVFFFVCVCFFVCE